MTEAELLRQAAASLRVAGVPDPVRDARLLWRASFPKRFEEYEAAMAGGRADAFQALVKRRAAREPMSHLIGHRDFYAHRFEVGPGALDPRPETETLVEAALAVPFQRVLDLGTGTGCILLSVLAQRPGTTGVGVDLSPDALKLARRNLMKLETSVTEDRVALVQSDWFDAVEGLFDLILSNPPYIAADEMADLAPELRYEPRVALTDEGDGLACYRGITSGAGAHLRPGGWLMVEIGPTQGAAVRAMFDAAGLIDIQIRSDLDGRDRVILGQKQL